MFYVLPSAVRADRMRGGRNKFGPFYRRDRQRKQLKGNTDPYRIKMETTQTLSPQSPNDPHLQRRHPSNPSSSNAFHLSHIMYPSSMGQSSEPMQMDRVLTPPSMPYHGLYCTFSGHPQDKGEMGFGYNSTPTHQPVYSTPNNLFSPRSTPSSSPCHAPSPATILSQVPSIPPSDIFTPNLLSQLLKGEQDEAQLCAKVLTSLQREQANQGKHDRLNTFSIMCKMADQTLFGLVEWARNSNLFKELKVKKKTFLLSF